MAQTLNFLTEHKLLDYGTLCNRTDEVTARFHELFDKIKAAETRMPEVAALRQQIINYVKTRDVYTAYRKAGYSKQFLAEHESEILLHKAAKKAFVYLSFWGVADGKGQFVAIGQKFSKKLSGMGKAVYFDKKRRLFTKYIAILLKTMYNISRTA